MSKNPPFQKKILRGISVVVPEYKSKERCPVILDEETLERLREFTGDLPPPDLGLSDFEKLSEYGQSYYENIRRAELEALKHRKIIRVVGW